MFDESLRRRKILTHTENPIAEAQSGLKAWARRSRLYQSQSSHGVSCCCVLLETLDLQAQQEWPLEIWPLARRLWPLERPGQ